MKNKTIFEVGTIVEVRLQSGWWTGTVAEVIQKGVRYRVEISSHPILRTVIVDNTDVKLVGE